MILQRAILCFHPSTTPNYINYNMKLLSGMSHLDLQPPTPSPQNIPNTDNLKLTWTGRWRCNDPNSGTVFGVTHCSPRAPPSLPLQQVSPDWQRHLGSSLNTLSSKLSP